MQGAAIRGIVIVFGLSLMGVLVWQGRHEALAGQNDFVPLYHAGQVVGTPELYDAESFYAFQRERFGAHNDSLRFTRPPCYALVFAPLARLPYLTAYALYSLASVLALVAFFWLWRTPSRADTVLFAAWHIPLFASLMNGQDTLFLLVWIALAWHWFEQEQDAHAGGILALCAAKFHLFTLLPLWMLATRRWKALKGFAAGAGVLLGLSFVAGGASWPVSYFETLTDGRVHPTAAAMPNLHGLLAETPSGVIIEALLSLFIVGAAWYSARTMVWDYALAIALVGGLLLSFHSYLTDSVLLLPAVLAATARLRGGFAPFLGILLITPVLGFTLLMQRPASYAMQAALVLFFAALVWEGRRLKEGTVTQELPTS